MTQIKFLTVTVDRVSMAGREFQSLIHISPEGWSQSGEELADTRDLAAALFDGFLESLQPDDGEEESREASRFNETLRIHGFTDEVAGGGVIIQRRDFANGAHILVTDIDGGSPDADGWAIGVYPAGWDGEDVTLRTCEDGQDFETALRSALEEAAPASERLADRFTAVVREWATEEEFAEICSRNAAETVAGICHSHDFMDANMAMDQAWQDVFGREVIGEEGEMSDDDVALWNKAWSRAAKGWQS